MRDPNRQEVQGGSICEENCTTHSTKQTYKVRGDNNLECVMYYATILQSSIQCNAKCAYGLVAGDLFGEWNSMNYEELMENVPMKNAASKGYSRMYQ